MTTTSTSRALRVPSFSTLSDADLLAEVTRLAVDERLATMQLIASLAELDARRLYLGQGCSSLFVYCTRVLHLSEHAAYNRIEAARLARRFPVVLDLLADGSITLTTVCLLAAHLTPENHRDVLNDARHQNKRAVEVLVARLRPSPIVPSSVRKLPAASVGRTFVTPAIRLAPATDAPAPRRLGGGLVPEPVDSLTLTSASGMAISTPANACRPGAMTPAAASRPAVVAPLTPDQYKVQVTVSRATVDTLRRIQDLMRHTVPDGDPAVIVDRALTLLLAELERTKLAATERPRHGRHIPATVRRAVWARDRGQCAFVGTEQRRCQERGFLEFHHTAPYAAGGEATTQTIELRCRAHNLYEAELDFGPSIRARRRVAHATDSIPSP
jgi:hypothetical protein